MVSLEKATQYGGFAMNFGDRMAELQKILDRLEGDELPLEEALTDFEKGVRLLGECRGFLEEARQKVTQLAPSGEEVPYAPSARTDVL